jgi:hypothetical protein
LGLGAVVGEAEPLGGEGVDPFGPCAAERAAAVAAQLPEAEVVHVEEQDVGTISRVASFVVHDQDAPEPSPPGAKADLQPRTEKMSCRPLTKHVSSQGEKSSPWAGDSRGLTLPHHRAWQPGQAEIAAVGGADRRSAKNASAGVNQSREAHLAERSLHSPSWGMTSGNGAPGQRRGTRVAGIGSSVGG